MKHSHSGLTTTKQDAVHANKVTLVGALFDTLLGVLKIITGVLGHSAALVADGIHSLSDLATDAVVLVSIRLGGKAADKNHPFGHRRIETLGTVLLGLMLLAVALGLLWQNSVTLLQGQSGTVPAWPVLAVAALSWLIKESLYWYTIKAARAIGSDLLSANAWHSRSDAFSSIVVLIGAGGAMLGIWWLDALAALLVAVLIALISVQLLKRSLAELIDTAIPEQQQQSYHQLILQMDGIHAINAMRSRTSGGKVLLELKLEVAPRLSASEAHWLGTQVKQQLQQQFSEIGDILVHINSPASEVPSSLQALNIRPALTDAIKQLLHSYQLNSHDVEMNLYYQDPILVDILLNTKAQQALHDVSQQQLEQQLQLLWPAAQALKIRFYLLKAS
ncbi:cation diffusion facilitator family transporter [Alkalimonas collagenimarina]|uniref:Cation diffusion facilitator family transporter n=1 Tax=Alkalimonas collagenimarina TaxID=400390 RepID=A0ABT9GXL4_9GAMM|nr:cation diffusion facilitator family transporter [Alkalimonas collagenimarina]MDP4535799.1 cation diffusion facilitator family transporter [Alkalimonas collagenimarina]